MPLGINDQNPICESGTSPSCVQETGIPPSNTHLVSVLDGENPAFYDFRIRLEVKGGNSLWFPVDTSAFYRLRVKCPDSVDVYAANSFSAVQ